MKKILFALFIFFSIFSAFSSVNALAGFAEVVTTHKYNNELLIEWGHPSDSCPYSDGKVCILLQKVNDIQAISKESQQGMIILQTHGQQPWILYDYKLKKEVQRGDTLEEVSREWSGQVTMIDSWSVENHFPITAQSFLNEFGFGISIVAVLLFFPFLLLSAICLVLFVSAQIRYRKTKLPKWNKISLIMIIPVAGFIGFYICIVGLIVLPVHKVLIFAGYPNEAIIKEKMDEYGTEQENLAKEEDLIVSEDGPVVLEPEVSPEKEVLEIQEAVVGDYKRYTNTKFGFSLDIPTQNVSEPINIFEVDDGVYVSTKTSLISILQNEYAQPWYIQFAEVNSEKELTDYLKKRYEPGCEIEAMFPSQQEDVYDIRLQWKDPYTPEEESCFINYITHIKYAPKKNIVVTWDIGQDANFYNDDVSIVYDEVMSESFRLLD